MNYNFRKKPVEIQAFQMTAERVEDRSDWPDWLVEARTRNPAALGSFWVSPNGSGKLFIKTSEGIMEVTEDDWIIKGVVGELYPCKPKVFDQTYDEVVK